MLTFTRPILILGSALCFAMFATAPLRADEADDQFAVAAGHYDRGHWKLAAEEFRVFLEKHPADRRANHAIFFLGEAMLQLGQFDDARTQFQKYANREPEGKYARAALFRSAEAAYLAGRFDAARPELEQFLAKYPQDRLNAFVLPYLGEIALSAHHPSTAVEYFRDGLKRFPEGQLQDDCRLGLARALEKLKQCDEAERLLAAVAGKTDSPLADAAQFHLGALQYGMSRYEQALKSFAAFEDRFANSPWHPNAKLGHGLTLLKLDRPAEACRDFDAVLAGKASGNALMQQALQGKIQAALQSRDYAEVDRQTKAFETRFPQSPLLCEARRMLARSLVERKQYEQASTLLESLVSAEAKDSRDLESRYLLALSYDGLGRYEQALAALLPVLDAAEGQLKADAQLAHGSLLLSLKKYSEAIAPLETFLATKPARDDEVKALGELAICYARAGQLDKAKKLLAEIMRKHPGHAILPPIIERLAEAAYDANDPAWSAELSRHLTAGAGSSEYAVKGQLGLGWSQYKEGKLAEAAASFENVLKANPPAPIAAEAAMARGCILEKLGQRESALAMYALVVERFPDSQQHEEALASAAQLRHLLGQESQAALLYEQLRAKGPQSRFWANAVCRLAQRAFDTQQYDAARNLIAEVLTAKTDPRYREYAWYLRAQTAAAESDWPAARQAFETLLAEFPETSRRPVAEFWIAETFYRQGDLEAAGARLDSLAKKMPQNREPWMGIVDLRRAQILAQRKQWNDAYALAAAIEKNHPAFDQQHEVDYLLGRCLADRADFDGARQAYRKAITSPTGEKTETAAMAQWMIGETYFHQKNYEAACREYLRVEILYAYPTWQAAALFEAGKCYELLGNARAALDLYRRILKDYPKTPFAEQATQRITQLLKTSSRTSRENQPRRFAFPAPCSRRQHDIAVLAGGTKILHNLGINNEAKTIAG